MGGPCKDCEDRYLGCHGKCLKYKNYRSDMEDINKYKRIECEFVEYSLERKLKMGCGRKI